MSIDQLEAAVVEAERLVAESAYWWKVPNPKKVRQLEEARAALASANSKLQILQN